MVLYVFTLVTFPEEFLSLSRELQKLDCDIISCKAKPVII